MLLVVVECVVEVRAGEISLLREKRELLRFGTACSSTGGWWRLKRGMVIVVLDV